MVREIYLGIISELVVISVSNKDGKEIMNVNDLGIFEIKLYLFE